MARQLAFSFTNNYHKILTHEKNLVPCSPGHVDSACHASRILVTSSFEEQDADKSDALAGIQEAIALNPENPRSYFLDGMMTSNLPEFIGGGPEAAKLIRMKILFGPFGEKI